jgi:glutathione S-transferase
VAFRAQSYGLKIGPEGYVDRLLALPAMREWYEAALAETWRIARYEDDARAAGEVTADLRAPP